MCCESIIFFVTNLLCFLHRYNTLVNIHITQIMFTNFKYKIIGHDMSKYFYKQYKFKDMLVFFEIGLYSK